MLLSDIGHSTERRSRVILADDNPDILAELCRIVSGEFEVVGMAENGIALRDMAVRLRPDAIVTDICMPGIDGLRCGAALIGEKHCQAVVLLTMHKHPAIVAAAFASGIKGFVLKEEAGEHLMEAIRTAIAGLTYASNGATLVSAQAGSQAEKEIEAKAFGSQSR